MRSYSNIILVILGILCCFTFFQESKADSAVPYVLCPSASSSIFRPSSFLFNIENVTANVWPPVKGQALDVLFWGVLLEDLSDGAYIIDVKFDTVTIYTTKGDVSELLVNQTLPLKNGTIVYLFDNVTIPSTAFDGTYQVVISASDANGEQLVCLQITFVLSAEKQVEEKPEKFPLLGRDGRGRRHPSISPSPEARAVKESDESEVTYSRLPHRMGHYRLGKNEEAHSDDHDDDDHDEDDDDDDDEKVIRSRLPHRWGHRKPSNIEKDEEVDDSDDGVIRSRLPHRWGHLKYPKADTGNEAEAEQKDSDENIKVSRLPHRWGHVNSRSDEQKGKMDENSEIVSVDEKDATASKLPHRFGHKNSGDTEDTEEVSFFSQIISYFIASSSSHSESEQSHPATTEPLNNKSPKKSRIHGGRIHVQLP